MNSDCQELIDRWPLIKKFALPAGAHIAVVGAYKGLAVETLANLYPEYAKIYAFEPQLWAAQEITQRCGGYRDINVYNFGLGLLRGTFQMGEFYTDACSFVNVGEGSREQGTGNLVEASEFLSMLPPLDLMIMNIEGYEYHLLPHLHLTGMLKRINRLAVQWHLDLAEDMSYEAMDAAIQRLQNEDGFFLDLDERPTWTYFVPAWSVGDV